MQNDLHSVINFLLIRENQRSKWTDLDITVIFFVKRFYFNILRLKISIPHNTNKNNKLLRILLIYIISYY